MRILGVDPGNHVGIALYDTEEKKATWLKTREYSTGEPQICDAVSTIVLSCADVVVIEDQFMGMNVNALKIIMESRCAWQNAAVMSGKPVELVYPRQWQSVLGVNKKEVTKKRKLSKIKAAARACSCTTPATEHEQCAVLIAKWYADKAEECNENVF